MKSHPHWVKEAVKTVKLFSPPLSLHYSMVVKRYSTHICVKHRFCLLLSCLHTVISLQLQQKHHALLEKKLPPTSEARLIQGKQRSSRSANCSNPHTMCVPFSASFRQLESACRRVLCGTAASQETVLNFHPSRFYVAVCLKTA